MFVKAKQSGELLAPVDKRSPEEQLASEYRVEHWSFDRVSHSAEKIKEAYENRDQIGLEGLLVVSGAGNIIRGDRLREQRVGYDVEDALGRLATIQNTLVLAASLELMKVPHKIFISDNMGYVDPTFGTIEPYDVEAEKEIYAKEHVALIAGGTGEDNKTTDNAVMEYARRYAVAYPDDKVVVLKGTKHDGVYTADPEKQSDAIQFATIPAAFMLKDYERFKAVDRDCLEAIINTGLNMRIYKDSTHDLTEAISAGDSLDIGTLITPTGEAPIFADA